MQRVVSQYANGATVDSRECRVNAFAKAGAQFQHAVPVCQTMNGCAAVICTGAVLRHYCAQGSSRRRAPVACLAGKERQIQLGGLYSSSLVVHQHVNHAIAVLHGAGANLLRLEHPQATALYHGRAAHADVAVAGGNDYIAAAQQGRIAGKAAPGHHAHHRHLPIEARKACKGLHMQPCHDGHVHIARPATAAFGKQDDRQAMLQGQTQHAVGLLVVAHALRSGKHGGVISHDHNPLALHSSHTCHHAIGRRVGNQVFGAASSALCCDCKCTVFHEGVRVTQVGDVFSGRSHSLGMAFGNRIGACHVQGHFQSLLQRQQIGPYRCHLLRVPSVIGLQPLWDVRQTLHF